MVSTPPPTIDDHDTSLHFTDFSAMLVFFIEGLESGRSTERAAHDHNNNDTPDQHDRLH